MRIRRKYLALMQIVILATTLTSEWWRGGVVVQLVEAVPYKQEVREFDSRWGHWDFSGRTMALESTPRVSPGSKGDRGVELTTLPLLRTNFPVTLKALTSWNPQGCPEIAFLYSERITNICSFVVTQVWSTNGTMLVLSICHSSTLSEVQKCTSWIIPTDAPNSNFIGITTVHVLGSLSAHHQEFLAVHRLWYVLCSCDDLLLLGVGSYC